MGYRGRYHPPGAATLPLAVAAMGVVFGDIGTSPLYAFKEAFSIQHCIPPTPANILGVLSLVFWSLIIVVTIKYLGLMMRADNRGEGGIMALMALTKQAVVAHPRLRELLLLLGILGASLFFGDGMITPAISILAATEGLAAVQPDLQPFAVPFAVGLLLLLFFVQRKGIGRAMGLFGPIMLVWFAALGIAGLRGILLHPDVLSALHPLHAFSFFSRNGFVGFMILGAVVLAITGGEALSADMGLFGRRSIRVAWFCVVLPALTLNYFGQGALLLADPHAAANPFFLLVPEGGRGFMVLLALAASCIASQAVISGAFHVTRQAILLGYAPRIEVQHTTEESTGPIFVPLVNWLLLLGSVSLVLGFGSTSRLAAAYGIAVTGTMILDTILLFFVARLVWRWRPVFALGGLALFFVVDLAFLLANAFKVLDGGWFPLAVGLLAFTLLATWKRGSETVQQRSKAMTVPLEPFLAGLNDDPPHRVPGLAIFLTGGLDGAPFALVQNLVHNQVLHERNILLTVTIENIPHVPLHERVTVYPPSTHLGVERVTLHYGFSDHPDILADLRRWPGLDMTEECHEISFFASRLKVTPASGRRREMPLWRKRLYAAMVRNSGSAIAFLQVPSERVVELGVRVDL